MKKLRIYFDTSVINFYYADDAPSERQATIKLIEQVKKGKQVPVEVGEMKEEE